MFKQIMWNIYKGKKERRIIGKSTKILLTLQIKHINTRNIVLNTNYLTISVFLR